MLLILLEVAEKVYKVNLSQKRRTAVISEAKKKYE